MIFQQVYPEFVIGAEWYMSGRGYYSSSGGLLREYYNGKFIEVYRSIVCQSDLIWLGYRKFSLSEYTDKELHLVLWLDKEISKNSDVQWFGNNRADFVKILSGVKYIDKE